MWAVLLTGLQLLAADPADEAVTHPPAYYDPAAIREATRRAVDEQEIQLPLGLPLAQRTHSAAHPLPPQWPEYPVSNNATCIALLDITPQGSATNIRVRCTPVTSQDWIAIPAEQAEGWEFDEPHFVQAFVHALERRRYFPICQDCEPAWGYDHEEIITFSLED